MPTPRDVHVDAILSNISIAYTNDTYIGEQIFPAVKVDKQSDKYYIFDQEHWFRDEAKLRAPGGASEGGGFSLSTDTYFCQEFAWHDVLPDEVKRNADSILRIETAKVNFVTEKILLKIEREIASKVQTHGNWGNSTQLSGTSQWSDYDNSDPIADIETGIQTVQDATGQPVNTMVLSVAVWRKLRHHPQLLDRLAVTSLRTATLDTLKALVGVDKILVGSALYNSSNRGVTASYSHIWNKNVWLGHVSKSPARETPAAGYVFIWTENGQMRGIRRWRDERHHSDIIEGFTCFDPKVTGTNLGYVIRDSVA